MEYNRKPLNIPRIDLVFIHKTRDISENRFTPGNCCRNVPASRAESPGEKKKRIEMRRPPPRQESGGSTEPACGAVNRRLPIDGKATAWGHSFDQADRLACFPGPKGAPGQQRGLRKAHQTAQRGCIGRSRVRPTGRQKLVSWQPVRMPSQPSSARFQPLWRQPWAPHRE